MGNELHLTRPARVFFSYAHKDAGLVGELVAHLANLRRRGLIEPWHDAGIEPGQGWDDEIKRQLDAADIILLLVSADFCNSTYINDVELARAMARHEAGEARVIPVILRACDDWQSEPYGRLQALPTGGKPVSQWDDKDAAFTDVARAIRNVVQAIGETFRVPAHTAGGRPPSGAAADGSKGLAGDVDERPGGAAEALPFDYFFLNHTSFLRKEKQEEFRQLTGVPLPHYDIRVIVDSYYRGALDRVERVEYLLHSSYPESVQVRTAAHRAEKFLLKELANGEYVLMAEVYLKDRDEPIPLQRYITLSESGPRIR